MCAVKSGKGRKPPFYRNLWVKHAVNPLVRLSPGRRAELAQEQPCIILGRGHSGTRVVTWICHHLGIEMGTDPSTRPSGDPVDASFQFWLRWAACAAVEADRRPFLGVLGRNLIERAVADHADRNGLKGRRWGWKFPECLLTARWIHEMFPRGRFIYLLRDGRSLALRRHLTDDSEHILARQILRRRGALGMPHHLQAAHSWAWQIEHFATFRQNREEFVCLDLRFEEMVSRPLATLNQIAEFLAVPVTPAAREFVQNEIDPNRVDNFRKMDANQLREIESAIGTTLEQCGYSKESGHEAARVEVRPLPDNPENGRP